ncbi:hypothetical protein ONS95_010013 [Cadophora gregata]|uniref:uncharacterized protein n=1 Tax=Cadophora gregata TaxID=51156 RepID=UPI0026DABD43|nr:uncharacterized protein ONS95_010013 [Cadophora gregata]KAK0121727.1 hypothetical protein ONS95_010013 [Cadophora gregata]KAK0127203.1 hypothetical protein ONS96_006756 [Cadophora gregata f. sp. sojae]
MTSQGFFDNNLAHNQLNLLPSCLFSALSAPCLEPRSLGLSTCQNEPTMKPIKDCKRCLAKAAKCWKKKVCSLCRRSNPDVIVTCPSESTNSAERRITFNNESNNPRGQCHALASSHDSRQSNNQLPSRSSSSQYSGSTKCENSPDPSCRYPIPDPSITLPSLPLLRRLITSFHLTPPNSSSRSSLIKASCIPQLDWTRADCRDWIAAFIQEISNLSPECSTKKARGQMEAGDRIYYTHPEVWLHRWPYLGADMYFWLHHCRNEGLVKGVKPDSGHMSRCRYDREERR